MNEKITLDFLKSMLKDKQKQIHNEPYCELWDDEEWQLKRVIELVEMEIINNTIGKTNEIKKGINK